MPPCGLYDRHSCPRAALRSARHSPPAPPRPRSSGASHMRSKLEALSGLERRGISTRGLLARLWALYFAHRPAVVLAMGLYLVLVHLAALGLFWRSEWPGVVAWNLGLGARWVELDRYFGLQAAILRSQAAAVAPGATLYVGDSQLAAVDIGALTDHAVQLSIVGETTRRARIRI